MDGESGDSNVELEGGREDSESLQAKGTLENMIASLYGVKKYMNLNMVGQACGKDVMVMIDSRASHKFIDANFVERKNLKTKGFEGFRVLILMGNSPWWII